jgi:hypothetical protein
MLKLLCVVKPLRLPKIDDLTVPAGTFEERIFYVTIADEQLNLRILDDGGTPYWVITALSIEEGIE